MQGRRAWIAAFSVAVLFAGCGDELLDHPTNARQSLAPATPPPVIDTDVLADVNGATACVAFADATAPTWVDGAPLDSPLALEEYWQPPDRRARRMGGDRNCARRI